MGNDIRGDGTTTRQIEAMPQGGIFIWCNDHPQYARHLANHVGRGDIKVISLTSGLGRGCERLRGIKPSLVAIDHAAILQADAALWGNWLEWCKANGR